jgi:hypothetical protein
MSIFKRFIIIIYLSLLLNFINIKSNLFLSVFSVFKYLKNNIFNSNLDDRIERNDSKYGILENNISISNLDSSLLDMINNLSKNSKAPIYLNINIVDKGHKNNVLKTFSRNIAEEDKDYLNELDIFKRSLILNKDCYIDYKLLSKRYIIFYCFFLLISIQLYIKYLKHKIYNSIMLSLIIDFLLLPKDQQNINDLYNIIFSKLNLNTKFQFIEIINKNRFNIVNYNNLIFTLDKTYLIKVLYYIHLYFYY